jgi:hypothetical protein
MGISALCTTRLQVVTWIDHLFLEMLHLAIVSQATEFALANGSIVGACVPYSLDHFSQPNIIGLEFVETPHNQQCCNVERPVEELAKTRVFSYREVVGDARPVMLLAVARALVTSLPTGNPYASG